MLTKNDTKGPEALKEQLASFEQEISAALTAQMTRINKAIEQGVLPLDYFLSDELLFIRMYLDETNQICFDLPGQVDPLTLEEVLSEEKVPHWELIRLLELL